LSGGRRRYLLLLLVGFATALPAQDATKPPPDDEFLEFLGSVDSEEADGDWLEYLAQLDIVKASKAKKETPPTPEVKPE
jgi:hypothetical protein